jgi:hypothetical protein
MIKALDWLIPRFITEEVALSYTKDGYVPVCSMRDLSEGETPDATITMSSFNLFGFGLFPKYLGEVKLPT